VHTLDELVQAWCGYLPPSSRSRPA
jgi:hypothetical protein